MAKAKASWVVAGGKLGEMGHCTRCGEGLELGGPQRISVVAAAMNAFVECHLNCKEGDFKEPTASTPQQWLKGRDTGTSSCTIYAVMMNTNVRERYDVPHDPDDFGRCYRLLSLFPAWVPRLADVAIRFKEWAPFVREWDRLTAMYEAAIKTPDLPAREMYNLMRDLEKEGCGLRDAH
jgi:hypothetical protein